ncbi:glycosyltransferase family 2 protein [Elizabethkingia anophelis]|uniref:glycosyltransferase family 2 protein n=1 Tax=Elizabethkingia anophelis TaxID=1117645 RepID=UPI0021A3D324|nr:glycosyltransferase family 2 protein [Elizabethkingia anophelis]
MNLTVASIVYNENNNIKRFLDAIHHIADEVIIVDSFSTDQTKNICLKYPKVKFYEKKFEGYGSQKNYAIDLCSGKWILFLDADEIPNQELINEIIKVTQDHSSKHKVYKIKLNNILFGDSIRYGGWGNVYRERLFKKQAGRYSDDIVHEKFLTDESKGVLSGEISHYTYKNIHHHVEKINLYSQMMAKKMILERKRLKTSKIIIGPIFTFIKTYFIQHGWRDGIIGYYYSVTLSYYTFLKYLKLYEKLKK